MDLIPKITVAQSLLSSKPMELANKIHWRAVGLAIASLSYAFLASGTVSTRILVAGGAAIALLAGSRHRQLRWILCGMRGHPLRGGDWAGALCGIALCLIFARVAFGVDFLVPT